jgi:hypothetical protein
VENRATRPNSRWLKQLNTEQWLQFVQDCCTPGTQHQKLEKVGQQAIALVFFDRQEQTCTNEGDNNRNDDIRIHVLGLPTDLPPKSRPPSTGKSCCRLPCKLEIKWNCANNDDDQHIIKTRSIISPDCGWL